VCRGDWVYGLVEVYLATGTRRGELLALEWPDIDWLTGTITISKSLEETEVEEEQEPEEGLRVTDRGAARRAGLKSEHRRSRFSGSSRMSNNSAGYCSGTTTKASLFSRKRMVRS
jgi:integrase